jgi:hypothetical protein
MTKLDPIIAVKDIAASSQWYQAVFSWKSLHGGGHFDILSTADGEVMLCLHPWERDGHPTMMTPNSTPGNGLILYFRTENMAAIRQNIERLGYPIAEEVHPNPNSLQLEFSLRDPDGYYLTITDFHRYDS